jgi:threonine/homoserine/homoserine lactone efflux protein
VYPDHGSIEWLPITAFGLLALVIVVTWAVAVTARLRGRRAPRWVRRLQSMARRG